MYKPAFNSVLVEIDKDEWGTGNDDSLSGKSYREGTVMAYGSLLETKDYPVLPVDLPGLGNKILWNEGHEAGTVFEEDGKMYGFIYWWDIRGVK